MESSKQIEVFNGKLEWIDADGIDWTPIYHLPEESAEEHILAVFFSLKNSSLGENKSNND